MRSYLTLGVLCLLCSCSIKNQNTIEIQGHRGARGLAPENTIPAFLKAIDLGVTTLELDIVVSKDSQLVVSHEPYFSSVICRDPFGGMIPEDSLINMYDLVYDQIKNFDCGTLAHPRFPEQKLGYTVKPLLSQVFDSVDQAASPDKLIRYNIELKTRLETDNILHPSPSDFSDLLYSLLLEKDMLDRVTIQSFDFRTLQYFHQTYPELDLVLLIENDLDWRENLDSLGFIPDVYSPYYPLLSWEIINELQQSGMRVVPWTVNEPAAMEELIQWGVDGLITDYPDRALQVSN